MDLSMNLLMFVIGTIFGSFVNVIIYRIPKNISLLYPPSSCVECGERLRWYENVPIVSYLLLQGKCRHCGTRFSISYPAIEVLFGVVFVILYAYAQNIWHFIYLTFLMIMFISMSVIDYKHFILPDKLLIITAGVSLLYYLFIEGSLVVHYITSALITFLILFALRVGSRYLFKRESLGMGDLKLGALIGFLLGWKPALIAIFFGFNLAGVVILILYLFRSIKRFSYIPFAPFMIGGMFTYVIWGRQIIHWYMQYVTGH